MATHSSILAWRVLWTQEPGGLQSMGSKESDMIKWLTLSHFLSRGREGRRAGRGRSLAMYGPTKSSAYPTEALELRRTTRVALSGAKCESLYPHSY